MFIRTGTFWELLYVGQHQAGPRLLWQKTQLGWVFGGTFIQHNRQIPKRIRCDLVRNSNLDKQIYQIIIQIYQIFENRGDRVEMSQVAYTN